MDIGMGVVLIYYFWNMNYNHINNIVIYNITFYVIE